MAISEIVRPKPMPTAAPVVFPPEPAFVGTVGTACSVDGLGCVKVTDEFVECGVGELDVVWVMRSLVVVDIGADRSLDCQMSSTIFAVT